MIESIISLLFATVLPNFNLVLILVGDKLKCRGAVANPEWVITAAECVNDKKLFAASGR